MLLTLTALAAALLLLIWSAGVFVQGAAAAAARYKMPALLARLLTGGLITATPELTVAALASLHGAPSLALGTAWGACIMHLSLLVGLSALVRPLRVRSRALLVELGLLIAAIGLTATFVLDGVLDRRDAVFLLLAFLALLVWVLASPPPAGYPPSPGRQGPAPRGRAPALRRMAVGGFLMLLAGRLLVWAATELSFWLGIGQRTVGLTVLAAGTTLPALAACLVLARRNTPDLVVGHAAGASLFNLLAVAGLTAFITPVIVDTTAIARDLPVMAGLTLALLILVGRGWGRPAGGRIGRGAGWLLTAAYLGYMLWLLRWLAPPAG